MQTLASGTPIALKATIPFGGKFNSTNAFGKSMKCINAQKQEKKIITSENKNTLKPVIIFLVTRIVKPPSLDSHCKSLSQLNLKYNKSIKANIP